jgi:hypothetical protein
MPLAAGFDPDFDDRWFGWFNPAETALRAVQLHGGSVSAIATTWAQESELVRCATTDVAIGVVPAGTPADAVSAALTRSRSHRLETIAADIFQAISRAAPAEAEGWARQVTQQVVFSGPGMSPIAQSVGRAVAARRWPPAEEWAVLRAEYESARLMAGSQRPGLMGIEEPLQRAAYHRDFVECRRAETLLGWENSDLADVVYAAILSGLVAPSLVGQLRV